jgi:hypothetical protein
MAHKDFTSARRAEQGESVTFTLNGESYEAAADAPGGALLDIAAQAGDETANDGARAMAIATFLDSVLLPDSAERFADRFRDPLNPITLEQAVEVLQWLVGEVYVGRPTATRSPSANGRSRTGRPSTAAARPVASIPSTSQPADSAT